MPVSANDQTDIAAAPGAGRLPGRHQLALAGTDQVGAASYNQSLSERRPAAAANYLVEQGVRRTRIATRGMGENEPVDSNDTELGRQRSRVEVAIYASGAYRAEVAKRQSN